MSQSNDSQTPMLILAFSAALMALSVSYSVDAETLSENTAQAAPGGMTQTTYAAYEPPTLAPSAIVLQGVPKAPVQVSQYLVVQKELELVGSASCNHRDMEEAISHLAAGRVRAEDFVTAVVPLEQADEMFDALLDPAGSHLKVLLAPNLPAPVN